jgi:phosphatidylinositol glycan class B
MVAHKEIRFLFPIINFIPFIIVKSLENSFLNSNWYKKHQNIIYKVFITLFLVNIICLTFASFRPAGKGRAGIVGKIHHLNNRPNLNIFITEDYNPKYRWLLNSTFYKEENINFMNTDSLSFSKISFSENNTRNVLISSINDIEDEQLQKFIKQMNMKKITQTFPEFSFPIFKKINMGSKVFLLFSD